MRSFTDERGQALLECALTALLITPLLALSTILLHQHWRKLQCAHGVFEVTQARLEGRNGPKTAVPVHVRESASWVEGTASCGNLSETVRLPKLEGSP